MAVATNKDSTTAGATYSHHVCSECQAYIPYGYTHSCKNGTTRVWDYKPNAPDWERLFDVLIAIDTKLGVLVDAEKGWTRITQTSNIVHT